MKPRAASHVLGDELPRSVAAYFDAADAGRADDALEQLSPQVLVALPPERGHEVDPRRILRGREEARRFLDERDHAAVRHEVLVCVSAGRTCLVEGLLRRRDDGTPSRTFVSSFRLDGQGCIERYLVYACEPVGLAPRADERRTGDARRAIDDYLHALDDGRFEEATAQFSEDVVYNHPPYRHTGIASDRRVVFNGRAELLAAFRQRGKTVFTHRMLEFLQRGPNALFELVVEGLPGGGTGGAVCSLSLDDDGRIKRYLAFYSEVAAPRS